MAVGVFLRGVNVGRHRRFRPSVLAAELAHHRLVNIGAAGTFVAHGDVDPELLREDILHSLPFRVDLMIRPAEEILGLIREEPFGHDRPTEDRKRFVSILGNLPQTLPPLPIDRPLGPEWEVRVLRVVGPYAFSLWRRRGRGVVYPNEVVEENLGVTATTRGWTTIVRVCSSLETE